MSGEGKRSGILAATALLLDSTVLRDTKSLLWYKHVVETLFGATKEALAWPSIAPHRV